MGLKHEIEDIRFLNEAFTIKSLLAEINLFCCVDFDK